MAKDNKSIGRFHLDGIPPAPRGVPQVEVTFDIDANGILNVSAKDKGTGKEQKIRIEASSGLTDEEIEKMKNEAKANEESDKAAKEKVDKINEADAMIFQTEKQMSEFGDKLSDGNRTAITAALDQLKEAHKTQEVEPIEAALGELNTAWTAASQEIYAAQQAAQGGAEGGAPQGDAAGAEDASDDATDVEFEEVEEEKK